MSDSYVFAADTLSKFANGSACLTDIKWVAQLFLTPLQAEAIKHGAARGLGLLSEMALLDVSGTPAAVAIGMARNGEDVATCPTDELFAALGSLFAPIVRDKSVRNSDLIVSQLAIRNDFHVVTADTAIVAAVRACHGSAMLLGEFAKPQLQRSPM